MNDSIRRTTHSFATAILLKAMSVLFALTLLFLAPAGTEATEPASDAPTARFETNFMQEMIDHHGMGIEMGRLCLERAKRDELKGLCQEIINAQGREIQILQGWLGDWYQVSYLPQMRSKDTSQLERLSALRGDTFQVAIMQAFINHHRMAIDRAQSCVDRAEHPELIELCQGIISTQTAEIGQFQTWLCEWYGVCIDPCKFYGICGEEKKTATKGA